VFKTRLLRVGPAAELRLAAGAGRAVVVQVRNPSEGLAEAARGLPFVSAAALVDGRLEVSLADPERDNPALVRRLVEAGAEVQFVAESRQSLEEVYLGLVHQA
jgi:ABC-2 type transport system ATP-binding protein